MKFLSTRWRFGKLNIWLFIVELPLTVAMLALAGIADPDLYRTKLWQDGSDNGFNSNPNEILYDYANHRPPNTPMVWSQFITSYNVVISVLGMFILLVKTIMYTLHIYPPLISALAHAGLVALFAASVRIQAGSDMSDPQHPQPGPPWYLTHSCKVVANQSNYGYCEQAKSIFAVTIVMMSLFFFHIPYAIWSMIPTKADRLARQTSVEEANDLPADYSPESISSMDKPWELQNVPSRSAMKAPVTPRTQAFNRLGGTNDLPLRTPH